MRRGISDKKIGDAKLAKREPGAKHPAQYFIRDRAEHFKLKVTERSKYFVWEARIDGKLVRKVLGEYCSNAGGSLQPRAAGDEV